VARSFTSAVDELHTAFKPLLASEHMTLKAAHLPAHFTSSMAEGSEARETMHSKIAFAQTLLDTNKAPLHYTVVRAQAPASTAPPHSGAEGTDADGLVAAPELNDELDVEELGEDVDESESAVLSAMRSNLATGVSPTARAAFADAAALRDFRAAYSNSKFAEAYRRYLVDTVKDDAAATAAITTSFGVLAVTHLRTLLQAPGNELANTAHHLVEAVTKNKNTKVNKTQVEAKLAAWAATAPPAVAARAPPSTSSFASSSSSSALPAGTRVCTRLVVSHTALSRFAASGAASLAMAPPARGYTEIDVQHVFAHSGASDAPLNDNEVDDVRDFYPGGVLGVDEVERERYIRLVSGSESIIATSPAFRRRWRRITAENTGLMRAALYLLALAPVHLNTYRRLDNAHCQVPIGVLLERPFRVYETASAVFLAPGLELGEIAWHGFNFMFSANAMTKELRGHVSMYAMAYIIDEARVYMANDCVIVNYLGGESHEPYSPESFKPKQRDSASPSMFFFAVPPLSLLGANKVPTLHDVTGAFDGAIIANRLTDEALRLVTERPHYPSAHYYASLYDWSELTPLAVDDLENFYASESYDNRITSQEEQRMFNRATCAFTSRVLNTDHFGVEGVYPGCGKLRTQGIGAAYAPPPEQLTTVSL